jgi:hypothetical protein
MDVMRRPYEIMADCELIGFPTAADVGRVGESLERARRAHAQVVKATVLPPAAFRDGRYILQTRFLVWAEDARTATRAVEGVITTAGLASRLVLPTGRALSDADVPAAPLDGQGQAAHPNAGGPGRRATPRPVVRTARGKGKGEAAKPARAKKTAARRKTAGKPAPTARARAKPATKSRSKRGRGRGTR